MADATYAFYNCIPDGAIDIANITPGDILNRAWSFRVNGRFEVQSYLRNGDFSQIDARQIARGYDGRLYQVGEGGRRRFLAQVNTWQAQFNPTTVDYNAAGVRQTMAVPMTYTVTLTFTETVVSDELFEVLVRSIRPSSDEAIAVPDPVFDFMGIIKGREV
jgi:hypothetical protein